MPNDLPDLLTKINSLESISSAWGVLRSRNYWSLWSSPELDEQVADEILVRPTSQASICPGCATCLQDEHTYGLARPHGLQRKVHLRGCGHLDLQMLIVGVAHGGLARMAYEAPDAHRERPAHPIRFCGLSIATCRNRLTIPAPLNLTEGAGCDRPRFINAVHNARRRLDSAPGYA
jgi:hypothetical protein